MTTLKQCFFQALQGQYTYELILTMTTSPRHMQGQTNKYPSVDEGEVYKVTLQLRTAYCKFMAAAVEMSVFFRDVAPQGIPMLQLLDSTDIYILATLSRQSSFKNKECMILGGK